MTQSHRDSPAGLTKWVIVIAVVCIGVLATVVLFEPDAVTSNAPDTPAIEGPTATNAPPVVDLGDPDLNVSLEQGGWVQIAGDDGELAQQYRFDHLDPDPANLPTHWMRMRQPQVQLFLNGGRTVTLTGRTLEAYAPKRALEQGTLDGNVIIRLFEPKPGSDTVPDIDTAAPSMVVRTALATFDNLAGRIECPGGITATSATERMSGRNLLVLLNDRDDRIEFLRLAEVDWMMLQDRSMTDSARVPAPAHAPWHAPRTIRLASTTQTSTQAGRQPTPGDASRVAFYRLRLETNVRVEQEDQAGRRLAFGDTMDVIFSMQSAGARSPSRVAARSQRSQGGQRAMGGIKSTLAALSLTTLPADGPGGQPPPQPEPGEILVTCDGLLTMIPLPDGDLRPPTRADTRLELRGSPVRLLDTSDRIGALCDRLEYRSEAERVDLFANAGQQVTVITDDVWMRADNLWAEMDTGRAGSSDTPGSAIMLATSPLTAALQDERAALLDPDAPGTLEQDLTIEWTKGVSVRFEPGGASGSGQMKFVQFNGDVKVRTPDGDIDTQSLEMRFVPDRTGKARPERFVATGNVRAHNVDQTLWSDTLVATLDEAEPLPDDDNPAAHTDTGAQDLMADARVRDFNAKGNVQVLLADGARAFADTLEGDARQEVVVLKGDNIVVARADLLIEHGTQVTIERKAGTAQWPGGGLARLLARPINVTQDRRIHRPMVPRPTEAVPRVVTMRATWNEAMTFDGAFADGAGALDLAGEVSIVAQQQPTERASLGGHTLRLEFASIADEAHTGPVNAPRNTELSTVGTAPFAGEGRVLSQLIATGKARLERRTWPTAARAITPEIIYIGGDRVTWDDINTKALVEGKGDFVTRQPAWGAREGDGPFRGPGTARFTWTNRLDMVREPDERFHIVMQGDVEGLWNGAKDPDDIATLSADAVTAITRRDATTVEPTVPNTNLASGASTALDFDGDASIERVTATGRVYLATPTRRADADKLDYNTRTGIARLEGRPGHPVAVVNQGAPLPVRAIAMIWNMDPAIDTITLQSPRGSGNR